MDLAARMTARVGIRARKAGSRAALRKVRATLWLAVALALLARALIPAGYMPVAQAGTLPAMIICTGDAANLPKQDSAPGKPRPASDGTCTFALAPIHASPAPPVPFPAPALKQHSPLDRPLPERGAVPIRTWPPQSPPTGPPHFA